MLSVIVLNANLQSHFVLCHNAACLCSECHVLGAVMLSFILLCVVILIFSFESRYAKCHFALCRKTKSLVAGS
jgi:hypothetical protein